MSYVTYDPAALNQQRYGNNYGQAGNPGGVGWMDPNAVKSNGNGIIQLNSYDPSKAPPPVTYGTPNQTTSTPTNSTPSSGAVSTLRNLNHRRPALTNSWNGWNSQNNSTTPGESTNFGFFSRFA